METDWLTRSKMLPDLLAGCGNMPGAPGAYPHPASSVVCTLTTKHHRSSPVRAACSVSGSRLERSLGKALVGKRQIPFMQGIHFVIQRSQCAVVGDGVVGEG